MESISLQVKGSSSEPYNIQFVFLNSVLSASCDCGAGKQGTYCKHRIDILKGDTSSVISDNINYKQLENWFKNSDIEKQLLEIDALSVEIESLKKRLEKSKKELSKLFNR